MQSHNELALLFLNVGFFRKNIMKIYQKLFLIPLLIIVVSCSAPPVHPPIKIAVFTTWATGALIYLAQEQGFFAKHHVQVELLPAADYQEILRLYRENKSDMSFMLLTDALMFESEGQPTRFIYVTDHSEGADAIVGQSIFNDLSELKGKKVSFEGFNTFSHLLVLKLLEQAGLNEGDFQAANLEASAVIGALDTGKIEAGHVYNPYISKAVERGYKILARSEKVIYLMSEGFIVNAKVAAERRQEVQAIIDALSETVEWWRHAPEQGIKIMAKRGGVSETELADTARNLKVLTAAQNKPLFEPNGTLLKGGREIVDFFYQKGVLSKIPELNKVIDGQFVATTAK